MSPDLLVEIGNTALKAAWTEGRTLGKTFRYQGEKTIDFIVSLTSRQRPRVLTVASVTPLAEDTVNRLSAECDTLIVLDDAHKDNLAGYGLPSYLTCDRVASLLAARDLFKGKPCTVFDFGTTMTVDVLDAEGSYVGGNISLGCRTRFKALNRYSRNLPLINTPQDCPLLANAAQTSMESGVISGIMFEIEGYIANYPGNYVIFTGGDAIFLANRMKNSIFVVCNLVMMGLALITEDYVKKNTE